MNQQRNQFGKKQVITDVAIYIEIKFCREVDIDFLNSLNINLTIFIVHSVSLFMSSILSTVPNYCKHLFFCYIKVNRVVSSKIRYSRENVWWINSFQASGGKSLAKNRSAKGLLIVTTNLDGLVWRIADDSPNLPNFLPAKFSRYTIHFSILYCFCNI